MEFLYIFTVIFISTFGLSMLIYHFWFSLTQRKHKNSVVIVPVYSEQDDIEQIVKSLNTSGIGSVILMDYAADEEQKERCRIISELYVNVYCCEQDFVFGK